MTPFLDTSVLIEFERSYQRLRELGNVAVPAIAVAEYIRGMEQTKIPRLRNRGERFLSRQIIPLGIVEFNLEAARAWAALLPALKHEGMTMKFGDSLIAAQCLAANSPIVTADDDFERVPGLAVIKIRLGLPNN